MFLNPDLLVVSDSSALISNANNIGWTFSGLQQAPAICFVWSIGWMMRSRI